MATAPRQPMGSKLPDPKSFLPLSPAVFHILLSLADGERHGYAIVKEVEARTEGTVRLGSGIFYRTVKQLLAQQWVEEAGERIDPVIDDQRRRYYRLTDLGRRVGQAEAARLATLVNLARAKQFLDQPELS